MVTSLVVVSVFVVGKYRFFDIAMAHANYGMRAICNEKEISSLYIGSSMFRQGINVAEIEPSAYLLSYNGNQPVAEELCLEYMLQKGANIKRLVVDMYPYSAANTPDLNDSRTFQDGDMGFTYSVYGVMKEYKGFAYLLEMLLNGNNEVFVTWPLTHGMVDSRYHRGSSTADAEGQTSEALDAIPLEFDGREKLQPLQMDALDRIIKMCRTKGIDIVFVETPKYYRVHANEAYDGMMTDYYDFLKERKVEMILCDKTVEALHLSDGSTCYITYSFENHDASNFLDLIHLSGKGRGEFSRLVGQLVKSEKWLAQ